MDLKWWLSFLLLYTIPDVQSAKARWIVDVPSRVSALEGSCVVIPCNYSYPGPKDNTMPETWIGFWKRGNTIVSTSNPRWKVGEEFKERAQIVGKLGQRDCTMRLNGVRRTDAGRFYFRIQVVRYNSFSYIQNPVSIDVIRNPEPPSLSVAVDGNVKAFCSVSHTCPSDPPRFVWDHSGTFKQGSRQLNKWTWETMSLLTFAPLPSDFNNTLKCSVLYSGGKWAEASTILVK